MTEATPDSGGVSGLEPGGGVPPGETPPAEGSESWAGGQAYHQPDVPGASFWSRTVAVVVVAATALIGAAFIVWAVLRAKDL